MSLAIASHRWTAAFILTRDATLCRPSCILVEVTVMPLLPFFSEWHSENASTDRHRSRHTCYIHIYRYYAVSEKKTRHNTASTFHSGLHHGGFQIIRRCLYHFWSRVYNVQFANYYDKRSCFCLSWSRLQQTSATVSWPLKSIPIFAILIRGS